MFFPVGKQNWVTLEVKNLFGSSSKLFKAELFSSETLFWEIYFPSKIRFCNHLKIVSLVLAIFCILFTNFNLIFSV